MRSNLTSDGQDDDCCRPQRSWGKVIFSQASVILSTGGSTWAGTPPRLGTPPGTRYTPRTRYTLPDQVHLPYQVHPRTRYTPRPGTPPGQVCPPRTKYTPWTSACREIQATSGRYASYWNAFLLLRFLVKLKKDQNIGGQTITNEKAFQ